MTFGFTRRFVDSLDTAPSQRDGLADAIEALQAEPVSEFSRCLNGLCIDVVDSLRAVERSGLEDRDRRPASVSATPS